MTQSLGNSYSISASSAGGKIVDRIFPKNPGVSSLKSSRFQSFREVFHDTLKSEFPELLSKAGLTDSTSLESKIIPEPRGYVISVPEEHIRRLQAIPREAARQEKLSNSFNSSVHDLTGSLVNMSV
ncbi:MAG: hypothetical protein HF314_06560 [Ignavibacteria bacterium]|nr:hypothetical protein [Ignavibacteria bacterium]MCU7502717.1 hypothetical protein [Ignavibacteria bacterium]MCU7517354.1 hypothetical protein [Ignavibacteria bacterium]